MTSDIIWLVIGIVFGYAGGLNKRVKDIPKDLEKCTIEKTQQEEDLLYYKKLTKQLVDDNKELRRKINEKR